MKREITQIVNDEKTKRIKIQDTMPHLIYPPPKIYSKEFISIDFVLTEKNPNRLQDKIIDLKLQYDSSNQSSEYCPTPEQWNVAYLFMTTKTEEQFLCLDRNAGVLFELDFDFFANSQSYAHLLCEFQWTQFHLSKFCWIFEKLLHLKVDCLTAFCLVNVLSESFSKLVGKSGRFQIRGDWMQVFIESLSCSSNSSLPPTHTFGELVAHVSKVNCAGKLTKHGRTFIRIFCDVYPELYYYGIDEELFTLKMMCSK